MQTAMMSHGVGVRPQKAFAGNISSLQKAHRVGQRMTARPVTVMSSAALEEVPSPEKRVRHSL